MGDTTIAWTDKVWNCVTGCTKVSQGCKNCYAERIFHRPYPGRKFTDVQCHPERLDQPLRWRKPCRIFVNSMSDLFHEDIPDDFILKVFDVMRQSFNGHAVALGRLVPTHTFQILTKRAERMRSFMNRLVWRDGLFLGEVGAGRPAGQMLTNVQLGVSVEDQVTADERIPLLLQTPAAVRFVSYEPALGPVDFRWGGMSMPDYAPHRPLPQLDWVIVGGESGPKARPFDLDWASRTIYQCKTAGVPVFLKQYGSYPIFEGVRVVLKDRAGADPAEWMDCMRVQEFPK